MIFLRRFLIDFCPGKKGGVIVMAYWKRGRRGKGVVRRGLRRALRRRGGRRVKRLRGRKSSMIMSRGGIQL